LARDVEIVVVWLFFDWIEVGVFRVVNFGIVREIFLFLNFFLVNILFFIEWDINQHSLIFLRILILLCLFNAGIF